MDHLVERYGLQKISLLREMCLKAGIQVFFNYNYVRLTIRSHFLTVSFHIYFFNYKLKITFVCTAFCLIIQIIIQTHPCEVTSKSFVF